MKQNLQRKSAAEAFDAEFAGLRQRFFDKMVHDTRALSETANAFADGAEREIDEDFIYDLIFKVHKLAGRGGTFGYPEVSAVAQPLEACLNDARDLVRSGDEPDMSGIWAQIRELARLVEEATPPGIEAA